MNILYFFFDKQKHTKKHANNHSTTRKTEREENQLTKKIKTLEIGREEKFFFAMSNLSGTSGRLRVEKHEAKQENKGNENIYLKIHFSHTRNQMIRRKVFKLN